MQDNLPKNVLDVLTHGDVAKALKGKTACACGGTTVYRRVTGTGTQHFSFTGVLLSKSYDFSPRATLRCEDCNTVIARAK